jgi:purine nucleosidase
MPARSIILDTDPGQDDAFAILLALGSPTELNILGICAASGNITVEAAATNALKVLKLAGRDGDLPVYIGASRPLVVAPITAEAIHGASIVDGWDLPRSDFATQKGVASDWIVSTVMNAPEKSITICALGPLTNIALALAKEPRIATRLHQIVMMGGACREPGNMNAVAEFNIFVDPHAAARVFASEADKVVVSLDVTSRLALSLQNISSIAKASNRLAPYLEHLLEFYTNYARKNAPRALHDPAVIAWLLKPELFAGQFANVEIDSREGITYGQTVVDIAYRTGRVPNAHWLTDINSDGFFELLTSRLAAL